jgi:flavin-binding protein dodecin
MTVARVTEITSRSPVSFEDAVQKGIARATETLRNVRSAWIKEQMVEIENGQIAAYQVDLKVTFVLEPTDRVD